MPDWGGLPCLVSDLHFCFLGEDLCPVCADGQAVAAGEEHESWSLCPWWQALEPARVRVPTCDHQQMCSPTRWGVGREVENRAVGASEDEAPGEIGSQESQSNTGRTMWMRDN